MLRTSHISTTPVFSSIAVGAFVGAEIEEHVAAGSGQTAALLDVFSGDIGSALSKVAHSTVPVRTPDAAVALLCSILHVPCHRCR
jgi:hypothetical protein